MGGIPRSIYGGIMRLIDADALKAAFEEKSSEAVCGVELCKAIIFRINKEPTVDAVPVVRCKDCKWWPYHPIERQIGYVKTFLCAIPPASKEDANGFCSMAERKDI